MGQREIICSYSFHSQAAQGLFLVVHHLTQPLSFHITLPLDQEQKGNGLKFFRGKMPSAPWLNSFKTPGDMD